jgi:molybdenum-dependent DNA-binding transcriptional regulator ModE
VKGISAEYDVDRKTVAAALAREHIPIGPPGGRSRLAIDPDWLRAQYLDRLRPLPDIARELGTSAVTLARMAKKHDIPLRGRGGPSHAESLAPPCADLPLPLAVAMAGQGGRERVRRFQVLARSSSIRQAAMRLGCNEVTLFSQLTRLESDCGAALVIRYTRSHQRQQLTPLGQGLLNQADEHLGRPSLVPLADVPPPLALAFGSLQGAGRVWRFLAVAKEGSIAAAARSLGTEQNILSKQMAALELSCGGRLFHRSAGVRAPQRLTDRGDLLVEQATLHVMSPEGELSRRASE